MKRKIILGAVLTIVLGVSALPLTTSAQKVSGYDYVMQDDSDCPVLKFNSKTGQYLFYDDEGLILAGIGQVRGTPLVRTMIFKNTGYFGQFICDEKTKVGTGSVTDTNEWETEATINDSNMLDSTGECAAE
jgi:hypothetical protein